MVRSVPRAHDPSMIIVLLAAWVLVFAAKASFQTVARLLPAPVAADAQAPVRA